MKFIVVYRRWLNIIAVVLQSFSIYLTEKSLMIILTTIITILDSNCSCPKPPCAMTPIVKYVLLVYL